MKRGVRREREWRGRRVPVCLQDGDHEVMYLEYLAGGPHVPVDGVPVHARGVEALEIGGQGPAGDAAVRLHKPAVEVDGQRALLAVEHAHPVV